MAEKKLVPYKSQFIYNAADNQAVEVKVDFEPMDGSPVMTVELSCEINSEDLAVIMDSLAKNLQYKMGFDIFAKDNDSIVYLITPGKRDIYEGCSNS